MIRTSISSGPLLFHFDPGLVKIFSPQLAVDSDLVGQNIRPNRAEPAARNWINTQAKQPVQPSTLQPQPIPTSLSPS